MSELRRGKRGYQPSVSRVCSLGLGLPDGVYYLAVIPFAFREMRHLRNTYRLLVYRQRDAFVIISACKRWLDRIIEHILDCHIGYNIS